MFVPQMPLAERLRSHSLDTFVGQKHLVGPNGIIRKVIESGSLPSMIFWGPPGVGKTTLANILANQIKAHFVVVNAISAGIKDIREVIDKAKFYPNTVLFIDEIHRFNKTQQDALLNAVEKGIIKLIGATTENPSFEVNSALISRCQVYVLQSLSEDDLTALIQDAITRDEVLANRNIRIEEYNALFELSGGDGRRLLNLLELVVENYPENPLLITDEIVRQVVQHRAASYDKKGDMHYDVISAFIKSVRGSDPNAAVYWLARMLAGGEDVAFIARRLVILAAEDIGIANPTALIMATQCYEAVRMIGMPEARILLSEATIYLAGSPKSNSAYLAIDAALDFVQKTGDLPVPLALRGGYTALNKSLGYGKMYKYPHDHPSHFVEQEYLPEKASNTAFYTPAKNAREEEIRKYLASVWKKKYGY